MNTFYMNITECDALSSKAECVSCIVNGVVQNCGSGFCVNKTRVDEVTHVKTNVCLYLIYNF